MTLAPATSRTGGRELPLEVRGRDFPTNRGGLCRKGWTSAELLIAPDRLTSPLIKGTDGRQRPASWDEALGLIAAHGLFLGAPTGVVAAMLLHALRLRRHLARGR